VKKSAKYNSGEKIRKKGQAPFKSTGPSSRSGLTNEDFWRSSSTFQSELKITNKKHGFLRDPGDFGSLDLSNDVHYLQPVRGGLYLTFV
jgi:hypothetical protein